MLNIYAIKNKIFKYIIRYFMSRHYFALVLKINKNGINIPAHITICSVKNNGSYTADEIRYLISNKYADFETYLGPNNKFVLEIKGWLSQLSNPNAKPGNSVIVNSYSVGGKFNSSKLNVVPTDKTNSTGYVCPYTGSSLKCIRQSMFDRMMDICKKYPFTINTDRTAGKLKPVVQHIDIKNLSDPDFKPGCLSSVTYTIDIM